MEQKRKVDLTYPQFLHGITFMAKESGVYLQTEHSGETINVPWEEIKVVNPGFTVAADYDPGIARSNKCSFDDYGMKWENSGKYGFYSKFSYTP